MIFIIIIKFVDFNLISEGLVNVDVDKLLLYWKYYVGVEFLRYM